MSLPGAQQCSQWRGDPKQPHRHSRLQEKTSANHWLLTHRSPSGAFLSQGHYFAVYHQIMGVWICAEKELCGLLANWFQNLFSFLLASSTASRALHCNPMQCTHLWKMILSSLPCGAVNLKVLLIIIRINIDFNGLQTLCVISLASQHRCKQGWCHTCSEIWVRRQR